MARRPRAARECLRRCPENTYGRSVPSRSGTRVSIRRFPPEILHAQVALLRRPGGCIADSSLLFIPSLAAGDDSPVTSFRILCRYACRSAVVEMSEWPTHLLATARRSAPPFEQVRRKRVRNVWGCTSLQFLPFSCTPERFSRLPCASSACRAASERGHPALPFLSSSLRQPVLYRSIQRRADCRSAQVAFFLWTPPPPNPHRFFRFKRFPLPQFISSETRIRCVEHFQYCTVAHNNASSSYGVLSSPSNWLSIRLTFVPGCGRREGPSSLGTSIPSIGYLRGKPSPTRNLWNPLSDEIHRVDPTGGEAAVRSVRGTPRHVLRDVVRLPDLPSSRNRRYRLMSSRYEAIVLREAFFSSARKWKYCLRSTVHFPVGSLSAIRAFRRVSLSPPRYDGSSSVRGVSGI